MKTRARMSIVAVLATTWFTMLGSSAMAAPAEPAEFDPRFEGAVPASVEIDEELHLVFPHDPLVTTFWSTFGHARSGGRRHLGEDLMAPKLSPVYAAADGVVETIAHSPRAGYYIVIRHAGAWSTWYVHLNNDSPGTDDGRAELDLTFAAGLEEGTVVAAGQLIGYVGDSGNAEATMPHTHFELHRGGRPIDPYPYLEPAYQRAVLSILGQIEADLLNRVDDQLRLAASSSSATRRAMDPSERLAETLTDSGVPVDGGSS